MSTIGNGRTLFGGWMAHRAEAILRALPKTVQTLLELDGQKYSRLIDYFVAGGHLDESVFLHTSSAFGNAVWTSSTDTS